MTSLLIPSAPIPNRELSNWWVDNGRQGRAPSPSTGFILPDGSKRSPDASWISEEKIALLIEEERKKFPPVVPDFLVEVRSESDSLARLKKKMINVWIKNGVRLAWPIDPIKENVYIYRQDRSEDCIADFDEVLSGEDVCVGFEFNLKLLKTIA